MKITSIKQQVKNPERASLFVDGKYSFSLSLNELVAEKLKINQGIDDTELKRLKKLSDDGKLKARALEWVLNRPRSIREFKDYMFRKKAEPEMCDGLVQDFLDRGYLDEHSYAKWLGELRKRKGKSNRAIQAELTSKGIKRELMAEITDLNDERERLKVLVEKKSKLSRYKTDPTKFMQYLVRQGYKYDDVKSVLAGDE